MRFLRLILCALFFSSVGLSLSAQPTTDVVQFPTITAYSLTKAKVTLPAGLNGKHNLLVLSFSADQATEINRWVAEAQSLSQLDGGLSYYLLPVSQRKNSLYRWWDNSAMRSDFSDPQIWPRVVPIYVNEKRFRRQLQIPDGSQIVILLTDRSGNVLWRTSGPLDQQKIAALQAKLRS